MEELRAAWFEAPGPRGAAEDHAPRCRRQFWQNPSYVPLGMYDQPTAYHTYLQDVRDGWPQFYGVKKNA